MTLQLVNYDEDGRLGELGFVGADQGDEDHYDDRDDVVDEDGRIKFSKKKLYGRDKELKQLQLIYNRLAGCCNTDGNSLSAAAVGEETKQQEAFQTSQLVLLSGFSGSGKSALVREFVNKLHLKKLPHIMAEGKYAELRTADPFSAICDALSRWCQQILSLSPEEGGGAKEFLRIWEDVENGLGSDALMLLDLMPKLAKIAKGNNKNCEARDFASKSSRASISEAGGMSAMKANKTRLMHAFTFFLGALCTPKRPLIMFIDDLQWADDGSLELFSLLLRDRKVKHIMFIMAYRSNEVCDGHPVSAFIDILQERRKEVLMMELLDLSRTDVSEFIGDTLGLEIDDVGDLSQAIFSKTLGNVFFTMQAMEQLVRKNALYYDTMIFCWQWTVSRAELENELAGDILEMVKAKIKNMPQMVQEVLAIASYIRANLDPVVLLEVVNKSNLNSTLTKKDLVKILNKAVLEGLLLVHEGVGKKGKEYVFAHDRIQEAARLIVKGKEYNELLVHIGNSLRDQYHDQIDEFSEDWMLFTAITLLNIVPSEYHSNEDKRRLADLNIEGAVLSMNVGGFDHASLLLNAALACLDKKSRWKSDKYSTTIRVFHLLLRTGFCLGQFDCTKERCEEILENATNPVDKGPAYFMSVQIAEFQKGMNRDLAIKMGVEILNKLGLEVPCCDSMTDCDIEREEKLCLLALGGRQRIDLLDSFPIEDDTILSIISAVSALSLSCGKFPFIYLLSLIATRICAEDGTSKHFPNILLLSSLYFFVIKKDNKTAHNIAATSKEMAEKIAFAEEVEFIESMQLTLSMNFKPVCDVLPFREKNHQELVRCGHKNVFVNAYLMTWDTFLLGVSVTLLTDAKNGLIKERCLDCNQPPSVYVGFSICQQYSLNLRGKSDYPCVFDGKEMTENSVLGHFEKDTATYKQTLRDLSIYKMMIACICGDLAMMNEMFHVLKAYPDGDSYQLRHLSRLFVVALAAFTLARKKGKKDRNTSCYLEKGNKYLAFFRDAAEEGNPNARLLFLCLQAESCQSSKNYRLAIDACRELQCKHFEGIMNEHCGLYKLEKRRIICGKSKKKIQVEASTYLKSALSLYHEYGAVFKVNQMKSRHCFL